MPDYNLRGRAPPGYLFGRRRVILAGAGALAGAAFATSAAHASDDRDERGHDGRTPPAPLPIPGGIQIGPTPADVIHVWGAGNPNVTLPFSGGPLQGLDYDSTTILNFEGHVAVAFHAGKAMASDGKQYNLETDIRAFEGRFALADGTKHEASFGFV
jgi:hypothetical protein